jgi:4-amino-4-deoxy-L-arabinose transferase-like glycosyltransferase
MLEQDDAVVIRFQDQPRFKKPVGIHWMQAVAASAFGDSALRDIRPYRLPSLLGAMLAAAACVWGAAGFFSRAVALMSGLILGAGLLLSTEAFIAKTDAMLTGLTVLCLAALARLYAEARGGPPAGRLAVPLFWLALALAILVKGPITPLIVGLAALTLRLVDRRPLTARPIGWAWGLILLPPDRSGLQLAGLAAALVLHLLWDLRSQGLPGWYPRLRLILTAGAVAGLAAGALV